jgi:hypothetical protein
MKKMFRVFMFLAVFLSMNVFTGCSSTPAPASDADYKKISLSELQSSLKTVKKWERFVVEACLKIQETRSSYGYYNRIFLYYPYSNSSINLLSIRNWLLNKDEEISLDQQIERYPQQIYTIYVLVKDSEIYIEKIKPADEVNYMEIPLSQLKSKIDAVKENGQGFIVNAYFYSPDYGKLSIGDTPPATVTSNNRLEQKNAMWVMLQEKNPDGSDKFPDLNKRIDFKKQNKLYMAVRETSPGKYSAVVERIDGLMSTDELKKQQTDAEDAKKKALEEANKYDAAKFTIVPADFKPADYTKKDLFDAVSTSEKMLRGNGSPDFLGFFSENFVSDVVFVSQSGTDITFKTADNAISQNMKVDGRSGLSAGQKARVYYRVSKNPLTEWRVIAIERR